MKPSLDVDLLVSVCTQRVTLPVVGTHAVRGGGIRVVTEQRPVGGVVQEERFPAFSHVHVAASGVEVSDHYHVLFARTRTVRWVNVFTLKDLDPKWNASKCSEPSENVSRNERILRSLV